MFWTRNWFWVFELGNARLQKEVATNMNSIENKKKRYWIDIQYLFSLFSIEFYYYLILFSIFYWGTGLSRPVPILWGNHQVLVAYSCIERRYSYWPYWLPNKDLTRLRKLPYLLMRNQLERARKSFVFIHSHCSCFMLRRIHRVVCNACCTI